jgi:hypothetical protein
MADKPQLDPISAASARPGDLLALTGAAFGAQTTASVVRFRVPGPGAAAVLGTLGTLEGWDDTKIDVRVPSLASFGSGGPLELIVYTAADHSEPRSFILEEEAPPVITGLDPALGLELIHTTITGSGFGRRIEGSDDWAVLFQAPDASGATAEVAATVVSWTPTSIEVEVPSLESLHRAGKHPVVVSTPWGRSAAAEFLLGELPQIQTVLPPSLSAGATIIVTGSGFGSEETSTLKLVAAPGSEAAATVVPAILSWSETKIVARIPGLQQLRTTGHRDLVVHTDWGESTYGIDVGDLASITSWTRLEPHARTADLQQGLALGLQARVYDALWLLARQWQLLELKGQDAGSPVVVQVAGKCTPLARWQPGTGRLEDGQAEDVPAGVPLEAIVERERDFPPLGPGSEPFGDLRLAAEAGLQLLRLIDARLRDPRKSDDYRRRFLREYPLELPADAASLDAKSRRFLSVAHHRVPDGARIYADFQVALGAHPKLPNKPPIDGNDRAAVLAAIQDWYAWCGELFSEATPGQRPWDPRRMEYAFAAGNGKLVLDAREHDGGHLDWYSFVRRVPDEPGDPLPTLGEPTSGRKPVDLACKAIPNPVSYPGMPVPRWWELEDRRVDFGSVAAAPNELLKLVLLEIATVYGNDWFTLPLDGVPVGSLCELDTVTIIDTFGGTVQLAPFGHGAGAGVDWRMFELTRSDGKPDAGNALLLLDALPATLESGPVEEVHLLRDELANLAWAVEKTVESRTGRPFERHEDEATRRPQPAPPEATAARRYLLQTTVPRNWIPLIPQADHDGGVLIMRRLARGAMRDPAGGSIQPLGRLLKPGSPLDISRLPEPGRSLDIFDEELPPTGVRVTRLWTLGRAANGRTHLWRARRAWTGGGGASSGLRFDLT